MRCVVTGCAGFVGSNLTDRLVLAGHDVVGIDNLSTGREEFLIDARASGRLAFHRVDLLDREAIEPLIDGADIVFHLAANADVRFGPLHPTRDFEQNTRATINVLEAMRLSGVDKIAFASSGSIYGEATQIPTPEFAPMPLQTSLYGASKIAAEGFIQAYCESFGMRAWIFRFVSLLGNRYSHGHVIDFVRQLREHPDVLRILGDGTQRKSYLHIDDALDAMLIAIDRSAQPVTILNLGTDEYCTVNDSAAWICGRLEVSPRREYAGGDRGWIGDNPFIFLDCSAMRALGWAPRHTIRESVERTVDYLMQPQTTQP